MARHAYISCHIHYVFSTRGREPWIIPGLRTPLFDYLGGIARQHKMVSLRVGGTADHVHHLVSLASTLSIAGAVQLLKGASSKWVHDCFPEHRHFHWQEGYAAFSVSVSRLPYTIRYIADQQEHHRSTSFEEELRLLLRKHEYDEPGRCRI